MLFRVVILQANYGPQERCLKRYFLLFCLICQLLWANTLKLVTGEYPPFTGEMLENSGASSELVTAVIHRMGQEAEYVFEPWKRGYHMVKNHVILGTFPYAITPERQKEMLFSDPINYVENRFFYKITHVKEVPHDWSDEIMQGYKIGVPLGYSTKENLEVRGIQPMILVDENELFTALDRGDIDFAAFSEIPGWAIIRQHYGKHVRLFAAMEKAFSRNKLHVMVSKNNPQARMFLQKFNVALQQIKEEGIYEDIMRKYRVRNQNFQ